MNYDAIKTALEDAPQTWLPALLKTAVQASVEKNVFCPGGLLLYVRKVEATHRILLLAFRDLGLTPARLSDCVPDYSQQIWELVQLQTADEEIVKVISRALQLEMGRSSAIIASGFQPQAAEIQLKYP